VLDEINKCRRYPSKPLSLRSVSYHFSLNKPPAAAYLQLGFEPLGNEVGRLTELDARNEEERNNKMKRNGYRKEATRKPWDLREGTGSPTALQKYPLLFFLDRTPSAGTGNPETAEW
jgi:hypothetical protein